ncbi:MAG: T9SS type A sorting domain-containing protein, partial [Bacteroidetes bacterium]
PANELVYIETANAGSIELYDLAGKLISQLKTEGKTTINTQALSVGTYNVRFLSDSGVTNVRLMINR